MRWLLWFCGLCAVLVPVGLGLIWASNGFASLGLEGFGLITVILMIIAVSAVAVALMALTFYSYRSGRDAVVYHKQAGRLRDRNDRPPAE
jgi:hypothetical protein